ncbi:MAG: VCBS repeat-containing protein [Candidatus Kerfeldbacteria bacterium]|nr:VCBS repeat-containing protein [Candidatus Kerfeldbacteria bacterium]
MAYRRTLSSRSFRRRFAEHTHLATAERVDIDQRIAISLVALSLGLISLGLGLSFLKYPAALLIVPTEASAGPISSATAVTISWTAPSSVNPFSRVVAYNLRYSTTPITEVNFAAATPAPNLPSPQPAGTTERLTVRGLEPATTYFFALKMVEDTGLISPILTVMAKTTDGANEGCVPQYRCSGWSSCLQGTTLRECSVINGCASDLGQPVIEQACGLGPVPEPLPRQLAASLTTNRGPRLAMVNLATEQTSVVDLLWPQARSFEVALGDVDGDQETDLAASSGRGLVRILTSIGQSLAEFEPYPTSPDQAVVLATGDVNGDGLDEILTVPANSTSQVRIWHYDPASGKIRLLNQIFAFPFREQYGYRLATGDFDLDGRDEFVVAQNSGRSKVRIFRLRLAGTVERVATFEAYRQPIDHGQSVAVGDVTGDGRAEFLTAPGAGALPEVKVFDSAGRQLFSFLASSTADRSGLELTTAEVDDDGQDEILIGRSIKTNGEVAIWRYESASNQFRQSGRFRVWPPTVRGQLRLGAVPHQ